MPIIKQIETFLANYPFLNSMVFGNKIGDYLIFLIVFLALFVSLRIFRRAILERIKKIIKKAGNGIGDTLAMMLDSVNTPFYWFLAFYFSVNILNLSPVITRGITAFLFIWIGYYLVISSQFLIDYILNRYAKKEKNKATQEAISTMGKFAKGLLWLFAALLVLSNLGINVTSLMAGLGIGGVAVAFALQNILNDLFSSFAIYFDKPFIVGDFIIVGEHMGIVEKIGIKTTRLRALQGEEIVISNRELTTARVQNFKKMKKRRVVFHIGVVYETSVQKLKKVNEIIADVIEKEKLSEFERVHFSKFGDFSLNFEIAYYVLSGNYQEFMTTHQNILFQMKEKFEQEKISMAFPTQTIHIEKNNNNQA